jgi:hypothetical protein
LGEGLKLASSLGSHIALREGEYVMDVSRLFVIAAAALVLGIPAAHAQDDDAVAAQSARAPGPPKPWKQVRGLGRVLDLSKPPVVIDEPGLYAIQQDWLFSRAATAAVRELIQIKADDVTLDLHGFRISTELDSFGRDFTLVLITGRGVEIRNGRLSACCDGYVAVHGTGGSAPKLHNLSIYSYQAMTFDRAWLTDSHIDGRGGIQFGERSVLERNTFFCVSFRCVQLLGDGNRVTNNNMSLEQGVGIAIVGNTNIVANNVIDTVNSSDPREAVDVEGDNNVVRGNTVLTGRLIARVFAISGTRNTLDGNIAAPAQDPGRESLIGMEFTGDGNYYGNNRMSAPVPFSLGGTVQTDWGGNVGY